MKNEAVEQTLSQLGAKTADATVAIQRLHSLAMEVQLLLVDIQVKIDTLYTTLEE